MNSGRAPGLSPKFACGIKADVRHHSSWLVSLVNHASSRSTWQTKAAHTYLRTWHSRYRHSASFVAESSADLILT